MTDYTERQQKLIERYRDFNVEHIEWWDCTYDDFKEDMEKVGIHVDNMNFSGFWSQGDGASFTGCISDNKLFLEHHNLTESYPWLTKLMSHGGGFSLSIERTGHFYVHENTVSIGLSYTDNFRNVLPDDGVRAAVIEQWDEHLEAEYNTIWQAVTDIVRGYCRDLYRRLEETYDYYTSDEAVWEAILANELDEEEDEEETV